MRERAAGTSPPWQDGPGMEHLRDDAPYRVCNACERKSWGNGFADDCKMPQPDGSICPGSFGGRVWPDGSTT